MMAQHHGVAKGESKVVALNVQNPFASCQGVRLLNVVSLTTRNDTDATLYVLLSIILQACQSAC